MISVMTIMIAHGYLGAHQFLHVVVVMMMPLDVLPPASLELAQRMVLSTIVQMDRIVEICMMIMVPYRQVVGKVEINQCRQRPHHPIAEAGEISRRLGMEIGIQIKIFPLFQSHRFDIQFFMPFCLRY